MILFIITNPFSYQLTLFHGQWKSIKSDKGAGENGGRADGSWELTQQDQPADGGAGRTRAKPCLPCAPQARPTCLRTTYWSQHQLPGYPGLESHQLPSPAGERWVALVAEAYALAGRSPADHFGYLISCITEHVSSGVSICSWSITSLSKHASVTLWKLTGGKRTLRPLN